MSRSPDTLLTELLLQTTGAVALQLDASERVLHVSNGALYQDWLPEARPLPAAGDSLASLLPDLFGAAQAGQLLQELRAPVDEAVSQPQTLHALPGRPQRLKPLRWFDVTLAHLCDETCDETEPSLLLIIAERTLLQNLTNEVTEARDAQQLALAVLRTEPLALRRFLQNANSAVGFIRTTLRQSARTQDALRGKLQHLRNEAGSLGAAASRLDLHQVAQPASLLVMAVDALLARDTATGDDMLPLALHIDALSGAVGAIAALEEQRAGADSAASPSRVPARATPTWHEICEQRSAEQLSKVAAERGVLACLRMKGAALVPESYHQKIVPVLESLIDNALRHGIETPEERIRIDKPASGTITVTFQDRGTAGLDMTVHDDGRGFDLEHIRRTAIDCGLTSEESGQTMEPRNLVGMIFKPGFCGASLADQPGSVCNMSLLRESLRRQGGNVSVATKPQRYTQFSLHFPATPGARRQASRHIAALTR